MGNVMDALCSNQYLVSNGYHPYRSTELANVVQTIV